MRTRGLVKNLVEYDAIILGAGGAGLLVAATCGQRGARVLLVDHAEKAGKKILISGGGRCNFTNMGIEPIQTQIQSRKRIQSRERKYRKHRKKVQKAQKA